VIRLIELLIKTNALYAIYLTLINWDNPTDTLTIKGIQYLNDELPKDIIIIEDK
jgi:hypothetical protein